MLLHVLALGGLGNTMQVLSLYFCYMVEKRFNTTPIDLTSDDDHLSIVPIYMNRPYTPTPGETSMTSYVRIDITGTYRHAFVQIARLIQRIFSSQM